MVNSFISKFAIIPPKKQVVKIKKIEADSDINGDGNHPEVIYLCKCNMHICKKTCRFSPVAV